MSRIGQYRRWYRYEIEMHKRVLTSMNTVPVGKRSSPDYQKALSLFGHILVARRLWLYRIGELKTAPSSFFPRGADVAELEAENARIEAVWTAYLDRLEDADLQRQFRYRSTEGDDYTNSVEDILTQLFGHSWYHRGQIALIVRALGGEPAETDYVFWTRQPTESGRTGHEES